MTKFIRKIDNLGRIVIPAEYRHRLGLEDFAEVCITEQDGKIIIENLNPGCKICGKEAVFHNEMKICDDCIRIIKEI